MFNKIYLQIILIYQIDIWLWQRELSNNGSTRPKTTCFIQNDKHFISFAINIFIEFTSKLNKVK